MMDDTDNISECSSTNSLDSTTDLDPGCVDLTNGDFSVVNLDLLNIAAFNINSLTSRSKIA